MKRPRECSGTALCPAAEGEASGQARFARVRDVDVVVVQLAVEAAHLLGHAVCAEGVETIEQVRGWGRWAATPLRDRSSDAANHDLLRTGAETAQRVRKRYVDREGRPVPVEVWAAVVGGRTGQRPLIVALPVREDDARQDIPVDGLR